MKEPAEEGEPRRSRTLGLGRRGVVISFSPSRTGRKFLISGIRPDGHRDSVRIKVAGVVSFLVMKGMALADRENEKDAYDIYFVLKKSGPFGLCHVSYRWFALEFCV